MSDKPPLLTRIWRFYRDGFREMTTGKSLWTLIIIKLVLIFVVMKLLFFPNLLKRDYDDDDSRADAVRSSLLDDRR
ncbi:MAG: DUF4492 domain-containing protein [Candidatus Amulumruptor caecigallinarius]|uniref:DUF4492 domain-containing protein n=1 Tax=Candidatus Amulumruptor caecigallinarius TaxID=2109911 RepID=A0A4Q0UA11_9BACT|nr:MAG: DUF4492 domain-containing protein [Candidatus Amulumruptor caecigallinarius]HJE39815.1 DUF4492 domain-containing protein [Candidatus Amulumruptor caecigallinarius]